MSDLPVLSILIVAYRSRDELPACLGSLPAELLGRSVDVWVVNNSPGDGLAPWLAREFPAVHLLEPGENLGFGRANNLAFRASAGECVLLLNPDTIANAPALEHVLRRALAEPALGLISPQLVRADGTMDAACRRSIPTAWDGFCRASGLAARFPHSARFAGYNLTHLPIDGTYDVGAINGAFMLGRREVLAVVAGPGEAVFDENFFMYGDDLDLCIRVAAAGRRIVYDGSHRIVHLKGVSVAKEYGRMATAIFDANRDVYLKHFGRTRWSRTKWRLFFGLWKQAALLRARWRGRRQVQPL